jgi:putative ABC transport system permease protein
VARVVRRALGLAAAGLLLAALGAFWAVRLLQGQLVGVGAADPLAHVGVTLLVLGLAALAALLPALRVARVDPADVLRGE